MDHAGTSRIPPILYMLRIQGYFSAATIQALVVCSVDSLFVQGNAEIRQADQDVKVATNSLNNP